MSFNSFLQLFIYFSILLLLVKPLGVYMANVYQGKNNRFIAPLENFIYRICNIHPEKEMEWKNYLVAMLVFNFLGWLILYFILRFQFYLPLNPQHFSGMSPELAFNTASSFVTNTNWQAYSGEITLSYLTQMMGLTVQNFISAATGMSLLVALIRGLIRYESKTLGNFWVDTVRGILYILLPLACVFAIVLSSQGVIQNLKPYQKMTLLEPLTYSQENSSGIDIKQVSEQVLPMGPVASQVAIKQLGSNGGGFFNTNSAHPFENPTPFTNFLEMLAILLIPAALCYMFGVMVNDIRQGRSIFSVMAFVFIVVAIATIVFEQAGNPELTDMNVNLTSMSHFSPGGNMEGKETRFGIANSALWATVTTATSNGSVNAMLDSFTPLGGMMPLWLMHLGEVVFGGVGSGLYGMLILIIITVFIIGLMVGRTPEYLGKKIEPYEMKMAAIAVLIMPLVVLLFTAIAVVTQMGVNAIFNPGTHGFSEILYAFTSMGNNNGSAFAGLNANLPFYNVLGGIEMLLIRFWIAIPTLAIAGSLVRKKKIASSLGTLPTHNLLFMMLLLSVLLIFGALTFFPVLSLGPIVEHLLLWGNYAR